MTETHVGAPSRRDRSRLDAAPAGAYAVRAVLLATAVILVAWVRLLPWSLPTLEDGATRQELSYRGADGRDHVYLADYDSYAWLRYARNYLRTGTTCDTVVDGACYDTYANAPVGRRDQYHRSLHVAAIVGLHRVITMIVPGYPLPASAYLVPVLVGILGVFPAFAIGRRLGGDLAGWCAAVLIGANSIFLQRSMGSDNDVWNLVLPLYMIWAGTAALEAIDSQRRILYAVLAAAFAALHAATWRGWVFTDGVLVIGLLGNVVVAMMRHLRQTRDVRVWRGRTVRRAVLVGTIVFGVTALVTLLTGAEETCGTPFPQLLSGLQHFGTRPPSSGAPALEWPNALSTVAELSRPNLAGIANYMGGTLAFFVGWLGLLVLLLPRHGWQWWHFGVLIGGNYLYRYLLTSTDLSRATLLALLAMPLVVAMTLDVFADDGDAEGGQGTALTIVLWFLAALFLSFNGLRFVMLLVPPFAIACAVAIGRLHGWLVFRAAAFDGRLARLASPVLFGLLAALTLPSARHGYETARAFRPRINDAWWMTLEKIRDETPSDAIVNTWWDYGYWVKYVAERRVSADGGSLQTHIPHWLGRALAAADEEEAIGLLRMLNCGSDATPEPEERAGALGRLVTQGKSQRTAHSMVVRLASMDHTEALTYLRMSGLSDEATREVLAASHCRPPPAYLVLTSQLINQRAWRLLGNWEPLNADARLTGPATRGLRWHDCLPANADEEVICPVNAAIEANGAKLTDVVYAAQQPEAMRLRLQRAHNARAAERVEGAPGLVLLAGAARIDSFTPSAPSYPSIAILLDVSNARILVGPSDLLQSTFTQLMFLDGRYARHFEKFDERTGFGGERVVTWKIDWGGRDPAAR